MCVTEEILKMLLLQKLSCLRTLSVNLSVQKTDQWSIRFD